MRYAALTVLAAMSTPLLVLACVRWVRSYTMTDDIYWYGEHRDGVSPMTQYGTSGGGFWSEARRCYCSPSVAPTGSSTRTRLIIPAPPPTTQRCMSGSGF